jgi:hypothetical protein
MADLDTVAPNYRRAQQRWAEAATLAGGYDGLNACFTGNGHGLVEYVKSFLESVCLTVMGELREPLPSSRPSTTDLLVAALRPLGLRNSRGATKLDKVLSGFNKLAEALTEMRDETGTVAHGKDGFLDAIAADHARAFLHTGDAILGVLLNAFEGKQPDLVVTREPYESFPHLNERIDNAVAVEARIDDGGERPIVILSVATGPRAEAIELRVEPSRLLYGIDRQAYIEVLKNANLPAVEDAAEETAADAAVGEPTDLPAPTFGTAEGPVADLLGAYTGALEALRSDVERFLQAERVDPATGGVGGRLIDSLLGTAEQNMALDWKQREAVQARLKIACKRVLIQFGCPSDKADSVAERFVTWLRVQAPDPLPVTVP